MYLLIYWCGTGILLKVWLCWGATKYWDLSAGLSVCTLYMGPLGETMRSIMHLNFAFSHACQQRTVQ